MYAIICFIFSFFIVAQSSAQASKTNVFNPDISVNFLGLWQNGSNYSSDRSNPPYSGFSIQETEIHFSSDVDPYLRANILLSIHEESSATETEYHLEPEEIFFETIQIPRLTIKAGKFKASLGKHNQLHTHAFPFIDAPLIQQVLLGDEGLNETGISLAYLLPFEWYSEIIVQILNSTNEELFASSRTTQNAGLLRIKNLWDLTDDLTFEWGLSTLSGKNQFSRQSDVLATDMTFKWRPSIGGKYHSLAWTTEYMSASRQGFINDLGESTEDLSGVVSWLQYQFSQRWWLQLRLEELGIIHSEAIPTQSKQSLLIGFFPSEFSGFRFQYDRLSIEDSSDQDHVGSLQFIVSIGAHPAHSY